MTKGLARKCKDPVMNDNNNALQYHGQLARVGGLFNYGRLTQYSPQHMESETQQTRLRMDIGQTSFHVECIVQKYEDSNVYGDISKRLRRYLEVRRLLLTSTLQPTSESDNRTTDGSFRFSQAVFGQMSGSLFPSGQMAKSISFVVFRSSDSSAS